MNVMCARDKDERSTVCNGDSGGPLYDKDTQMLVGITSWSYDSAKNCNSESPGIFSRVLAANQWIMETVCKETEGELPNFCKPRKYITHIDQSCDENASREVKSDARTEKNCRDACDAKNGCIAYQFFMKGQMRECSIYTKIFRYTTSKMNYQCSILRRFKPRFEKKNRMLCNAAYNDIKKGVSVDSPAVCSQTCRKNWRCRAYQFYPVMDERKCIYLIDEDPVLVKDVPKVQCWVKLLPEDRRTR